MAAGDERARHMCGGALCTGGLLHAAHAPAPTSPACSLDRSRARSACGCGTPRRRRTRFRALRRRSVLFTRTQEAPKREGWTSNEPLFRLTPSSVHAPFSSSSISPLQYAQEIGDLLRTIPRPLLLLLKTNDCLRSALQLAARPELLADWLIGWLSPPSLRSSPLPLLWPSSCVQGGRPGAGLPHQLFCHHRKRVHPSAGPRPPPPPPRPLVAPGSRQRRVGGGAAHGRAAPAHHVGGARGVAARQCQRWRQCGGGPGAASACMLDRYLMEPSSQLLTDCALFCDMKGQWDRQ